MSKEDALFFRQRIYELAGISLSDGKLDLLQSRLRSRVLHFEMENFGEYRKYLEELPRDHDEWELFINQLTTNKTDWFRESEHFDYLTNEFLVNWRKLGKKHLSVWCAASSTGEEPYTLSMVLHHALSSTGTSFEIVASDIDTRVLQHASNGVYLKSGLELIPDAYHSYAFAMGTEEISEWMKVKKEIKAPVKFLQLNLTELPRLNKKFDLIFCRNVLIYFNSQTISNVVDSMFEEAAENAVLVIAHSESLQNIPTKWKYVRPSIYRKGNHFT